MEVEQYEAKTSMSEMMQMTLSRCKMSEKKKKRLKGETYRFREMPGWKIL